MTVKTERDAMDGSFPEDYGERAMVEATSIEQRLDDATQMWFELVRPDRNNIKAEDAFRSGYAAGLKRREISPDNTDEIRALLDLAEEEGFHIDTREWTPDGRLVFAALTLDDRHYSLELKDADPVR